MKNHIVLNSIVQGGDAEPFVKEGLAVVGSGMGGGGIPMPNVGEGRARDQFFTQFYKNLLKGALADCDPKHHAWIGAYLDAWFGAMREGQVGNTVLPASRIAMLRLLFALTEQPGYLENLDDDDARVNLAAFVAKGLDIAAEQFQTIGQSNRSERVFTATLAVSYRMDGMYADVETVWAGNCRCYALTALGFKRLTDDGGFTTDEPNLFFTNGTPAALQYRKYRIALPCVLIAATDGVFAPFAPYDNLGLEATLLDCLRGAEHGQAFGDALKRRYDDMRIADATMAVIPLGFTSIQEWNDAMGLRAEQTIQLWRHVCDNRVLLKDFEYIDTAPNIVSNMLAQAGAHMSEIARLLAEAQDSGQAQDCIVEEIGKLYLERAVTRTQQELVQNRIEQEAAAVERIRELIQNPNLCEQVLCDALVDKLPHRLSATTIGFAFSDLQTAAQALSAAKGVFDENCRQQSNMVADERDIIALLGKRRDDIQKEREKIARERDENADEQNEIYHVNMVRINEKITWTTGEQMRLNELYRQSCNPYSCRFCDARCRYYATKPDALSKEIRARTKEKDIFVGEFYALRDQYMRLKNEYARLENKDGVLEKEDLELVRLLHAYESGRQMKPSDYQSGTARKFAERILQAGNRRLLTRNLEDSEQLLREKKLAYENAVQTFLCDEDTLKLNMRVLFQPEFLTGQDILAYESADDSALWKDSDTLTELLDRELHIDIAHSKENIINVLAAHHDKPTLIDGCFDQELLAAFRRDSRQKAGNKPSEIDRIKESLQAYDRACVAWLKE